MKGRHAVGNRPFGNIHLDYIKYKENDKDIRQMYKKVKNDYLKNKNLDINLEKSYLNERFINYEEDKKRYYFNILTIGGIAFLSGVFIQYPKKLNIYFIVFAIFIILSLRWIYNIHIKTRNNKKEYELKYYIICMKALKEIEELKLDKIKNVI